jgi:hypothetical protein
LGSLSPTEIGGPPPTHFAGAGPTATVSTHFPRAHPSLSPQAVAQAPQCALSFARSTQELSQAVRPGEHSEEQTPALQASAPVHLTPQPPQFAGSALVGMQTPLQSDWYAGQVQTPSMHP